MLDVKREGIMKACTREEPKRIAGDREHERGVDTTRQADHDALEAVLVHVIANAQHERVPYALLSRWQWRQAVRCNVEALFRPDDFQGGERFLEGRRSVHHTPASVHREAAPVVDDLVLAADVIQVCEWQAVFPGSSREVRLALRLLAFLEGRSIDGEHEIRAGSACAGDDIGVPDVLADDRRNPDAFEFDRDKSIACLEVALVVEYLVVR